MSLTTPYHGLLLTRYTPDAWHILNDPMDVGADGWDKLSIEAIKLYSSPAAVRRGAVAAEWPVGARIGGEDFWVVAAAPRQVQGNLWKINLSCHGLARERPYKIKIGAASEKQSAENVTIGGIGTFARAEIIEAGLTMDVSFVNLDGPPASGDVGAQGLTPPYTPFVRASGWTSLPSPLYHFPNGWTLESIDADKLPAAEVWLESHRWRYQYPYSP